MTQRRFPFTPTTSRDLEIGDFWAVELPDGNYGCLQVTDLVRRGLGSRTTLVAGIVDWSGKEPPLPDDLTGRAILKQGLTRIEAFVATSAQVLGNLPVTYHRALASNYRDFQVGAVHHVWGWQVLGARVAATLSQRR
jgi:hypothetical protein